MKWWLPHAWCREPQELVQVLHVPLLTGCMSSAPKLMYPAYDDISSTKPRRSHHLGLICLSYHQLRPPKTTHERLEVGVQAALAMTELASLAHLVKQMALEDALGGLAPDLLLVGCPGGAGL